jgi:hypothetical protein
MRIIQWYQALSLPARFALGAVLSALGSSGFIGVLTKFGAYWNVIYYGVRVPADGIPYVGETAAIISFLILLGAAFAFIATYAVLSAVAWVLARVKQLDAWLRRIMTTQVRKQHPDSTDEQVLVHVNYRVQLVYKLFSTQLGLVGLLWVANYIGHLRWLFGSYAVVVLVVQFVKPRTIAVVVATITILASFALWYPPWYASFLRTIGYGGGSSISVMTSHDDPDPIRGYLLLRTGPALLWYDGKQSILEIPTTRVHEIDYDLPHQWSLPPRRSNW